MSRGFPWSGEGYTILGRVPEEGDQSFFEVFCVCLVALKMLTFELEQKVHFKYFKTLIFRNQFGGRGVGMGMNGGGGGKEVSVVVASQWKKNQCKSWWRTYSVPKYF